MILTVADVREALAAYSADLAKWLGVAPDLSARDDDERLQAQDVEIDRFIKAAQRRIENDLQIRYDRQVVKCWPDAGAVYDIEEKPYDYYHADYRTWGLINLRKKPVISVERVRLMFGEENELIEFPLSWIRVDDRMGQVQIVPTPGSGWSMLQMQNGGFFLPFLAGYWIQDGVPQMFAVDYTVGVTDARSDAFWSEHWLICRKLAVREALIQLSDVEKPGLAGIEVAEDGLSQSKNFTRGGGLRYQSMINQIDADYEKFRERHQGTDSRIMFSVV